ncbi:hypothetical protein [Corynebacterium mastitidis]|uniref:hypothetical protein n=1 Tax=Corynebacterium mastitidis TaxID=161890 RepID=UPI00254A6E4B|nr:hypothetical protein [Corynebacterium mastitidis]MDK8450894.1 hypothetical protein [Corynebacterium mastitidis]
MSPLVTPEQVADYLGESTAALPELTEITEAVTALLVGYKGTPTDTWGADVAFGAKMLCARIYRRRNSPAGVEALGELGPVYVSRNDPDLAQLLKLGRYAPLQVG